MTDQFGCDIEFTPECLEVSLPKAMFLTSIAIIDQFGEETMLDSDDRFEATIIKKCNRHIKVDSIIVVRLFYKQHIHTPVKFTIKGNTISNATNDIVSGMTRTACSDKLLSALLSKIDMELEVGSDIGNSIAKPEGNRKVCKLDVSGSAPENHIHGEKHFVCTSAGRHIIAPLCGDIFSKDLSVSVDDRELTEEIDYRLGDVKINRMLSNNCQDMVYGVIEILTPIDGDVFVSYRAFGGAEVDQVLTAIMERQDRHESAIRVLERGARIGMNAINSLSKKFEMLERRFENLP